MSLVKIIFKISFVVFHVTVISTFAQEHLRPLTGNFNLLALPQNSPQIKKINTVTPLNLPFFDPPGGVEPTTNGIRNPMAEIRRRGLILLLNPSPA